MKYYCLASCDKCRAAKKLLLEKKIEHTAIDYRKDGISKHKIQEWINHYGLDAIVNPKSQALKSLSPQEREALNTQPIEVIEANVAILYRPILDFGDKIEVGKAALEWLKAI